MNKISMMVMRKSKENKKYINDEVHEGDERQDFNNEVPENRSRLAVMILMI